MFAIVLHHLVAKNSINIDIDIYGLTFNKLVLQTIGNLAFVANNLFFLISAYHLSSKKPELNYAFKSVVRMGQSVWFYGYFFGFALLIGGGSLVLLLNPFSL